MSVETLTYAVHEGVSLQADLYRPAGKDASPVVVTVPGGGWRFGSRKVLKGWGEFLATHGIALFAIDHRRSEAGKAYPEAVQDVVAAVQFVKGESRRLGLQADRVALMGASAGGHLASLVALAGERPPFFGAYPNDPFADLKPDVCALVSTYGVYDLARHWRFDLAQNWRKSDEFTERFLGADPCEDPLRYFEASPMSYATYDRAALPVLLIWGTRDDEVAPAQSEAFLEALRQARFRVRTCPVEGAGHLWFTEDALDDPHGYTAFVAPRILRFLNQSFASRPAR